MRYAAFVADARSGSFGPPPPGSWPAEWIAAHVVSNTELLIATTEEILATNPIHFAQLADCDRRAARM